jgi:hypothetical protein
VTSLTAFQGIHANEIAKLNNTDPVKAGAIINVAITIVHSPHRQREFFGSSQTTTYLPRFGPMCSPPTVSHLFWIPGSR